MIFLIVFIVAYESFECRRLELDENDEDVLFLDSRKMSQVI